MSKAGWFALLLTALTLGLAAPAGAQGITLGPDGETAPVFDYAAGDPRAGATSRSPGSTRTATARTTGSRSRSSARQESGPGLKVPAIVDASPYYTTVCRGNEGECIADIDADGVNDRWPLFYDNYFVPRGYAYVLAEMDGTANSTGCPLHGGAGDIAGMKSVIDWLNGRVPGYNAHGTRSSSRAGTTARPR